MTATVFAATAILLAGVVDDFRSRKFHNWLFLVCVAVALIVSIATGGVTGLLMSLGGFAAGIVIFLPLVLLKILGAGDMKLMAAFGIVAGWNAVLSVAIFSIFWGAAFGLAQVVLKGQLKSVLRNLGSMAINKGQPATELHKIPFTAALFVGWLTYLVYQGVL